MNKFFGCLLSDPIATMPLMWYKGNMKEGRAIISRWKYTVFFVCLAIAFASFLSPNYSYAALPSGFEVQTIVSGLNIPTTMAFAPDGRLFIAEKGGTVRIYKNNTLLPTPFITLTDVNTYTDRGLLGMALDPQFSQNGYVYLSYTFENTPGTNYNGPKTTRIVRVTAVGDTASLASKVVILGTVGGDAANPSCLNYGLNADCIPADGPSHNVGALRFGPDGKLYAAFGDASSFSEVDVNALRAQNLDSFAGKILRINKDGTAPTDNPFYDGNINHVRSKVWDYGVRNAFRFNFRPSNNHLYIGDVGWYTAEEVNLGLGGRNFGWPCREGNNVTPGYSCTAPSYVNPIYSYAHDVSGAASITGGAFYTGSGYPASYQGSYFFGDYSLNFIKQMVVDANDNVISVSDFMTNAGGPVEILPGVNGDMYYIAIYTNEVKRIVYTTGNHAPVITMSVNPISGQLPLSVTFSSVGTTDQDGDTLTYVWNFGDGSTSTQANTTHTYTNAGSYTATLTVSDGHGGSDTESQLVVAGNNAPTASIVNPANNSFYSPNQIIPLEGSGTDQEDGSLPESAYSWTILLHHNTHTHIVQTLSGSNPSFVAPDHNDTDVYIEARLTVTDSVGLTATASIDLHLAPPTTVHPFHISTSVNPPSPAPNTPITITTTVGNSGTPDPILIDIEVYNSANTKVAQIFYDNQTIPTNGTANYSLNYTPTVAGDYRVAVGLIMTGWAGLYEWTNQAAIFTVAVPPTIPNTGGGALSFDGINDYVDVGTWNIEEQNGFTFEARFRADAIPANEVLLSKSTGTNENDYLWMFGISGSNPSNKQLMFRLKTGTTTTTLLGGTVAAGEIIHASAVYGNNSMKLYKNGILVATSEKSGVIAQSGTPVWIGANPSGATVQNFNGVMDEMRVWNLPRTDQQILDNANHDLVGTNQPGLIKYWKMNEGFGQDTIDSSNSGHHGQLGSTSGTDTNDPSWIGGTYSGGGTFAPISLGTVIAPTSVTSGANSLITTTVKNNGTGAGFMIIDIEVYNSANVQVAQKYYDGQGFAPGEIKDFTFDWTSGPPDTYRVAVGLMILRWSGVYTWVNNAGTISVTSSTPPPTNLIPNPSVETASSNPPLPQSWVKGGTGTNTRILTYPVAGYDGAKAVKTEITSYTNGDAKWYFQQVPVTPGATYEYKDMYMSSTVSHVTLRYTLQDGTFRYPDLQTNIPAAPSWTQFQKTFSIPTTYPSPVSFVTVFHLIKSVGTITTDSHFLLGASTDSVSPTVSVNAIPGQPVSGTISLTATASDNIGVASVQFYVDGNATGAPLTSSPYTYAFNTTTVSDGAHTVTAVATDQAGNSATSAGVALQIQNTILNLVPNPGVETASSNPAIPQSWQKGGTGTNTRIHTYPVAGYNSAKAAKVDITSYTNGDAKWYFQRISVTPGQQYTFSDYYMSTIPSILTAQYELADGTLKYPDLQTNIPAQASWTQLQKTFTVPTSYSSPVVKMTVFHLIKSVGSLTVDNYSLQ